MGPDNRRILLATFLSVAIIIVWNVAFPQKQAPSPPPKSAQTTQPGQPGAGAPPAAGTAPAGGAPAVPAPAPDAPEETVTLSGDGFEATFTSHGGAVKSLVLTGEKFRRDEKGKPVQIDLVHVTGGQPYPLSLVASPELGGAQDLAGDPSARAPMRIVSKDAKGVVFEGRAGALSVKKSFRITGKPYEIALDVEAQGATRAGTLAVLYPAYMPPNTKSGGLLSGPPLEFVRPICRTGKDTDRFDLASDKTPEKLEGQASWAGVDQHYFVAGIFPKEPLGTCVFARGPEKGAGLAAIVVPV